MLFPSLEFLFTFLPLTLLAYHAAPHRFRNVVLVVASLVFYTWGGGIYVLLLLLSLVTAYATGRLAEPGGDGTPGRTRLAVSLVVAVNLGALAYYKYANWLFDQFDRVGGWAGLGPVGWSTVALPLGISFFSFQSMSYTFDVARGRVAAQRNPLHLAAYLLMFPHLLAGPIVRYRTVASQVARRDVTLDDFAEGTIRFVHGLAKKVIIADTIAVVADAAYSVPPGQETFTAAWIGSIAFALQLYFDFSGYSDMAIGLGRMFGFRLPENFVRPHSAVSVTDFWQRWHITLSSWFRDYLYTPIRGDGTNALRLYGGLFLTFVLIGLWHGAAWTFIAFGAIHGAALVVERLTGNDVTGPRADRVLVRRAVTMLVLLASIPFFRAGSMSSALRQLGAMVNPLRLELPASVDFALSNRVWLTLLLASVVFFLPRTLVLGKRMSQDPGRLLACGRVALMTAGLPYAVAAIAATPQPPFIYFRF
jgi:alginate O-acetyltransferase complex protein AlgI